MNMMLSNGQGMSRLSMLCYPDPCLAVKVFPSFQTATSADVLQLINQRRILRWIDAQWIGNEYTANQRQLDEEGEPITTRENASTTPNTRLLHV